MKSTALFFSVAMTAIFVQNLAMMYMLVSDVFVRVVRTPRTWAKYGLAITVYTTLSSALAWVLNRFVLLRFDLEWLSAFSFILVIVALELLTEAVLRRFAPGLRKRLGSLMPASAFICAILGLLFINVQMNTRSIFGTVYYGFFAGVGFLAALFIASSALERAAYSTPPKAFRGMPIAFITAGIISLAFMGFYNIRIPF